MLNFKIKLNNTFFIAFYIGLLAASDSELDDDPMPRAKKISVGKGMVNTKAKTINIDQSTHKHIHGSDYEEDEEDDLRDSFTSILGLNDEAYQKHETSVKLEYQKALKNSDFSELSRIATREKGSIRSPFAKAFLSHILLNNTITHTYPPEEGERHIYACIKFFKKLREEKRSGISLFLRGSIYEYEFSKTGNEEKKREAYKAYTLAAGGTFNDDEAQLRLGDWYKLTHPTFAQDWYQKAAKQGNQRAAAHLEELLGGSSHIWSSLDDSPDCF